MANSYNTNPIVLDTVMTKTAKNDGCVFTGRFKIKAIHWDNSNAQPGGTATLVSGTGNTFWSETAASSAFSNLIPPQVLNDFKLTSLAQGKVYIYLI